MIRRFIELADMSLVLLALLVVMYLGAVAAIYLWESLP